MTYKGIVTTIQTEVLQINRKIQKKTGQKDINRHFTEGYPRTAVYNITSTSSIRKEKEMKTKTIMWQHFTRTRFEELKSDNTKCCQGCRPAGALHGGRQTGVASITQAPAPESDAAGRQHQQPSQTHKNPSKSNITAHKMILLHGQVGFILGMHHGLPFKTKSM